MDPWEPEPAVLSKNPPSAPPAVAPGDLDGLVVAQAVSRAQVATGAPSAAPTEATGP